MKFFYVNIFSILSFLLLKAIKTLTTSPTMWTKALTKFNGYSKFDNELAIPSESQMIADLQYANQQQAEALSYQARTALVQAENIQKLLQEKRSKQASSSRNNQPRPELTPEEVKEKRAKKPCKWLKMGLTCPYGDNCDYNHNVTAESA